MVCLVLFILVTWIWHWPPLYELGLTSNGWHQFEHACFFSASMLFWFPVIQPWPSHSVWPRWGIIIYLLVADLSNTIFSAAFCFWEQVIYPTYEAAPRLLGMSALSDQAVAGAIMWVPGSILFLIPVVLILRGQLMPRLAKPPARTVAAVGPVSLPVTGSPQTLRPHTAERIASARRRFDVLGLRGLGRVLGHRLFRRGVQAVLLVLAGLVVLDGLLGPQISPMNLAGVLPWIHWRGFVVLALLLAGNLFCFACPFMLPRAIMRRFISPQWRWPRALRNKWLAVVLLVVFLFSYEAFSLWDTPYWTAWIVITYFAVALAIDAVFKGASFCKYVCPIGQFHFVQSMVSPMEVQVRDIQTCHSCTTYDCIRGNDTHRGCELDLFLPKKQGGLDCTWCLDCTHACPHDNVGILPRPGGSELLYDGWRSSLRQLSNRWDITALVAVLIFGGFVNALGMVAGVLSRQDALAVSLGLESTWWVIAASLLVGLIVVPPLLLVLAGTASQTLSATAASFKQVVTRFTLTLVPLGFSMWLVHMLFHFFTSWGTVIPSFQRLAEDIGIQSLGEPLWALSCCGPSPSWLVPMELLLLDIGLIATLWLQYRLAGELTKGLRRELAALLPWLALAVALWITGVWIVFQPMEMRGTMPS
jgi:polyferredoxin